MKIGNVETYLVDSGSSKHWLFVKVETDDGVHGWGEAYTQLDRDRAIDMQIRMQPWAQGYEVGVYDADAAPVAKETGEQILVMIREFAL